LQKGIYDELFATFAHFQTSVMKDKGSLESSSPKIKKKVLVWMLLYACHVFEYS